MEKPDLLPSGGSRAGRCRTGPGSAQEGPLFSTCQGGPAGGLPRVKEQVYVILPLRV